MVKKTKRTIRYEENKAAKVGEIIVCPICGKEFTKKQYSQAFCCSSCKDEYWNGKKKGKRTEYFREYNRLHPKRLERIGVFKDYDSFGEKSFGRYDEEGEFHSFSDERALFESCEFPTLGK